MHAWPEVVILLCFPEEGPRCPQREGPCCSQTLQPPAGLDIGRKTWELAGEPEGPPGPALHFTDRELATGCGLCSPKVKASVTLRSRAQVGELLAKVFVKPAPRLPLLLVLGLRTVTS